MHNFAFSRMGHLLFALLSAMTMGACAAPLDETARLYGDRCASCHGETGETRALGRSRKLSDMTAEEIEETLLPYQLGQPARGMKEKMKSGLSMEQIEALSAFAGKAP
ncbi:c-type cytochrome [uncultured Cohaesibacter sp.]|uniref:c-type cytochrome n=1 Tax=uncultured Cohaesibacter sp. TaxID=1002546 RepID=UPI0029C7CAFF|nr:c-type cytochrome [uncultured Cohaesibacter sp.]